jgi:hypothetical protein
MRKGWLLAILTGAVVLAPAPGIAQVVRADAVANVSDPADRTGTNPANLRDTLDLSNDFRSPGSGLFVDEATWMYAQAFAGRRMRARAELPLQFGNVTGRTEVGFGDVIAGWEWLAAARGRVAWLAGADVGFDSGTNPALATGHTVLTPSAGLAFVPRLDTVLSVRYDQRVSLDSVEDLRDINVGTFEAAIVRRFGDGAWIRAVPAAVFDYEQSEAWGRLDGEWGRVLSGGASTWVRAGGAFGASRPFDWTIVIGFRFVQ